MKSNLVVLGFMSIFVCNNVFAQGHHHGSSDVEDGLRVGGFMDFQSSHVDQDLGNDRNFKFANDTEIHIIYSGKTDNGLRYGTVVELEADVTEDFREEGENADKTYIFLENDNGRFELGSNSDAAHMIGVNASTFARGTGGPHGDWFTVVEFPGSGGAHAHGDFIHSDELPFHHTQGITEDANKISYYSPRIQGMQGGISFMSDTGDVGTAAGFSGKTGHSEYENAVSGGANYKNKIGEVDYIASLTGQYGKEEVPNHNDLKAYAAGINATYQNITVGGSYGDWEQSMTHSVPGNPDGYFWSAGAAYEIDRFGTSLTYFDSEYKSNQASIISLGADYMLAPGLVPYAEVTKVNLDAADTTVQDNEATVLLLGTIVNF